MTPVWTFHHPHMTFEALGYIPAWLDDIDQRPAAQQIDFHYPFGGWQPFKGFKLNDDDSLSYPGDPTIYPLASTKLRDETIVFYPHSWVAVIQPDRTFEIARID